MRDAFGWKHENYLLCLVPRVGEIHCGVRSAGAGSSGYTHHHQIACANCWVGDRHFSGWGPLVPQVEAAQTPKQEAVNAGLEDFIGARNETVKPDPIGIEKRVRRRRIELEDKRASRYRLYYTVFRS